MNLILCPRHLHCVSSRVLQLAAVAARRMRTRPTAPLLVFVNNHCETILLLQVLAGTTDLFRRRLAVVDSLRLLGHKIVDQVRLFQKWRLSLNLVDKLLVQDLLWTAEL